MSSVLVSEASLNQLDWLVAKARGLDLHKDGHLNGRLAPGWWVSGYLVRDRNLWIALPNLQYSRDSVLTQPLGESERMDLEGVWGQSACGSLTDFKGWRAKHPHNYGGLIRHVGHGLTQAEAISRCYVSLKLGDRVEAPTDLAG